MASPSLFWLMCGSVALAGSCDLGGWCETARGDVLVPRSGRVLVGRLVERNSQHVVFRERVESGKYIERRVPREECLTVVVTIDDAQLQGLTPERPEEYVAVAEQLALVPADSEARELAIRLSLIGGRYGSAAVRHRALLQLIGLARDPEEEVRFRKLAFLYDPGLPSAVLNERRQVPATPPADTLRAAVRVVQELRQMQNSTAQSELQKPEIQAALEPWNGLCSLEQLQRLATTRQRTSAELLQLLQLEYALRQVSDGWPAPQANDSWGEQIEHATLWQPTWNNVSEFDTSENQFVDGQWRSKRR